MDDLLLLVHRIPYPPDKGDKIRSYHLFRHLAQRYRLHLGCFIDDPADWVHQPAVEALCSGESLLLELSPWLGKLRSLTGLLTNEPLTFAYYRDPRLRRWVDGVLRRHPIRRIVVYSSGLAPLICTSEAQQSRRILDFVDVDSQKWRQYAAKRSGIMRWIFARESRLLLREERRLAATLDASLLVSPAEAALLRTLAPESGHKIGYWENGVDADYFNPDQLFPNPYQPDKAVICFTGAMDYWANVDAVTWFCQEIFPTIRAQVAMAQFVIVGARPTPAVLQLAQQPGVTVTGRVPDVRPYLAHARLAVAPLRIAQGVQNKVLEAMAMAIPVLATVRATVGIRLCPELRELVSDDPAQLAALAIQLLRQGDHAGWGVAGRRCVLERYLWSNGLGQIDAALEKGWFAD